MHQVVETSKVLEVAELVQQIQQVGRRLIRAQPKELAIGNIVRRVLGVIREEAEEDRDREASRLSNGDADNQSHIPGQSMPQLLGSAGPLPADNASSPLSQDNISQSSASRNEKAGHSSLVASHASLASVPTVTSMFSLLSHPVDGATPPSTEHPPIPSLASARLSTAKDLKAEVVEGIEEILDELNQADDQIAGYALDHIHSNELILTHSSSVTIQRFLLKAAVKRKFTVIHAEAFPNDHEATHATVVGKGKGEPGDGFGPEVFAKTLTAAGITVVLIPDSAVFAVMSRINKVLLSAHAVLADGSLIAAAGTRAIAKAARMHSTHVVVLSAVYQLSPVYPFDPDALLENGDPNQLVTYDDDASFVDRVTIENPLIDYAPAELIDLYITNL